MSVATEGEVIHIRDAWKGLRIAETAAESGFDPSAIRYYERIGLIPPARRNESGHRVYGDDDIERLKLISSAKSLGLTLGDIKTFLSQWERGKCPSARTMLKGLIAAKLEELRHQVAELSTFRDALSEAYEQIGSEPAPQHCGPDCGCNVTLSADLDGRAIASGLIRSSR